MSDLGVVIVTYQSALHIEACLASLRNDAGGDLVVVVDNASTDDTVSRAQQAWSTVLVVRNTENLGFARASNQGLSAVGNSPFVVFLNPDAEVQPGALRRLLGELEARPELGAVGPRTEGADGTPQLSFGPDLTPLAEWRQRRRMKALRRRDPRALAALDADARRPGEPDWLSASCLMARSEALRAVGGFDPGFFLYEEDADLCLRLRRAGWRLAFGPEALVVHHQGGSVASAPGSAAVAYHQGHLRYYAKHNGLFATVLLRAHLLGRGFVGFFSFNGERRRFAGRLRGIAFSRVA